MVSAKTPERAPHLPPGYISIPVHRPELSPLKLCVVARQTPDPAAGFLVLLRDLPDAMVYLGCVADAEGTVLDWVELWVQNVDGLESSLPAYREAFSNQSLDERWRQMADIFKSIGPCIHTGWETQHPSPVFLDTTNAQPIFPGASGGGAPWELCQDDHLLQKAGLPAFSTSLFRYLYQPNAGDNTRFVAVVAGAPQGSATIALSEALGSVRQLVPFNPQGGLMLVTRFGPVALDDYADLLGGKAWKGIESGKKIFPFDGPYRGLSEWSQTQQEGSYLFLGARGKVGRFVETFHLKLQLLAEALQMVRGAVQTQQLPFLNIAADSFRVRLSEPGKNLPQLWTAQCLLARPGSAFALPVGSSDFRYFIQARSEGPSIFLPEGIGHRFQGSASVRIRQVLPPDQGRTTLEGTLVLQDRIHVSQHDLLWIRLPLTAGRVDLYGHLYTTEGLAQGEARFRTLPQRLGDEVTAALRAAEGVPLPRSPFEVVPLLSSPCDLYSLGVLAVRTLLVNDENSLPVALDEMLSLARQVATEHKPNVPLGERIQAIFERDGRYPASLGPHRLCREKLEPKVPAQWLPPELWYDTLGTILRFFPGIGPDSFCKDFGDAPSLVLEVVFNKPMEEVDKLLLRSRSLIVIDWNANREVHNAIEGYLKKHKNALG